MRADKIRHSLNAVEYVITLVRYIEIQSLSCYWPNEFCLYIQYNTHSQHYRKNHEADLFLLVYQK
jgi:hypothetical protein